MSENNNNNNNNKTFLPYYLNNNPTTHTTPSWGNCIHSDKTLSFKAYRPDLLHQAFEIAFKQENFHYMNIVRMEMLSFYEIPQYFKQTIVANKPLPSPPLIIKHFLNFIMKSIFPLLSESLAPNALIMFDIIHKWNAVTWDEGALVDTYHYAKSIVELLQFCKYDPTAHHLVHTYNPYTNKELIRSPIYETDLLVKHGYPIMNINCYGLSSSSAFSINVIPNGTNVREKLDQFRCCLANDDYLEAYSSFVELDQLHRKNKNNQLYEELLEKYFIIPELKRVLFMDVHVKNHKPRYPFRDINEKSMHALELNYRAACKQRINQLSFQLTNNTRHIIAKDITTNIIFIHRQSEAYLLARSNIISLDVFQQEKLWYAAKCNPSIRSSDYKTFEQQMKGCRSLTELFSKLPLSYVMDSSVTKMTIEYYKPVRSSDNSYESSYTDSTLTHHAWTLIFKTVKHELDPINSKGGFSYDDDHDGKPGFRTIVVNIFKMLFQLYTQEKNKTKYRSASGTNHGVNQTHIKPQVDNEENYLIYILRALRFLRTVRELKQTFLHGNTIMKVFVDDYNTTVNYTNKIYEDINLIHTEQKFYALSPKVDLDQYVYNYRTNLYNDNNNNNNQPIIQNTRAYDVVLHEVSKNNNPVVIEARRKPIQHFKPKCIDCCTIAKNNTNNISQYLQIYRNFFICIQCYTQQIHNQSVEHKIEVEVKNEEKQNEIKANLNVNPSIVNIYNHMNIPSPTSSIHMNDDDNINNCENNKDLDNFIFTNELLDEPDPNPLNELLLQYQLHSQHVSDELNETELLLLEEQPFKKARID
jgi:hypothetical protein